MKVNDIFASVSAPDFPVSQFNGNHSIKTTLTLGKVTPTKCMLYRPGDNIRMHSTTTLDFVPLLSPNYQQYKLKEFLFKVRKGLTWNQEDYGTFLLSGSDGQTPPVMPFISAGNYYYFGDAVVKMIFAPPVGVYGLLNSNNHVLFQSSNYPSGSLNDIFLNFNSLTDDQYVNLMNSLRDAWKFEISATNKREQSEDEEIHDVRFSPLYIRPAFTHSNWLYTSGSPLATIDVQNPIATAPTVTINSTTFSDLGDADALFTDVYHLNTPFYRNSDLLESLGYPTFNYLLEQNDYIQKFKRYWNNFLDACVTDRTYVSYFFNGIGYSPLASTSGTPSYPLPYLSINPSSSTKDSDPCQTTFLALLQNFCEYAISHGHGDGSLCDSYVAGIMALKDLFMYPCDANGSAWDLDLGPLSSFWLIWSEYFLDSNQTRPIGIIKDSGYYLDKFNLLSVAKLEKFWYDDSAFDWCRTFDGDFLRLDYTNPNLSVSDMYNLKRSLITNEIMVNYTSIPSKCIDRNYFTSALPDISRVEVFAPVSATLPQDGVVPSMNNPTDVTPTQSVDPTTTFLSIEAFRTAQVLQNFFVNAMLSGPRPVQFILMQFGEHSQDFRMEVPVLVNASEVPISSRSVTQSAETTELPLGFEASKLSVVKGMDEGFDTITADGDHGYIIRMVCVYPEILEVGGANRELLCGSPFDWIAFPQFATLGEQSLMSYEVDAQPIDFGDYIWKHGPTDQAIIQAALVVAGETSSNDFGYTERYGNLKHIASETHGRFLTDLDYWSLDRIKRPVTFVNNAYQALKVSPQFLKVPVDNRQMVDSQVNNIKMFQYVECEFSRKLPMINPVKLL